ncbi:MAG: hypothetical protein PVF05_11760 [Gemmatimonadales bacterium]|jgi:tetratricopeptide (TPR) repeat protein
MAFHPFEELKRRKVFRVAVVYLAVGFVLLQVAELLAEGLLLPDTFLPLVTALLIIGFPVALILAWAFELTPDGLRLESPAPAEDSRADAAARPRWRLRLWHGVVAAVVLAGVYLLRPRSPVAESLAAPVVAFVDSVAILPIENHTGDSAFAELVAATRDLMVGRLLSVGSVKVTDAFSSRRYAELPITPRQMADSMGVEKMVYASLYDAPLRLRLSVNDGESSTPLWTAEYTPDMSDPSGLAAFFADSFAAEYLQHSAARATARPEVAERSAEDSGLSARGWDALGERTAAGLAEAREAFAEAIAADSMDARAYAGLSEAHSLSLAYRYATGNTGYRDAGLALAYANRAIELDSTVVQGYEARIYVATRSSAPLEEVIPDCRQALTRAPASPAANSWCGRVFNQQGDDEVALETMRRAIDSDPRNAGRRLALAYSALKQGEVDLAIEQADEAGRLEPTLMLSRAIEARALLLAGRTADCLRMELGPHAGIRAACLHEAGRPAEARAIVDSLEAAIRADALDDSTYTAVVRAEDLATYYAWIGDADGATEWAITAYTMSPLGVEMRVVESPLFDRVRDDGRFSREVVRMRNRVWSHVKQAAIGVQ